MSGIQMVEPFKNQNIFFILNILQVGGHFVPFSNGFCSVLITAQFDNHDLIIQLSDMPGIRIPTVPQKKHIACAQKWSLYNLIYVILETNLTAEIKLSIFQFCIFYSASPLCTEIGQHFFLSTDLPKNILTTNILHN